MDDEITTAEAAEMLGVQPRAVRWYWSKGLLAGRALTPRMLLFKRADVQAFVKPVHPTGRWGPVEEPRGVKPTKPGRPKKDKPPNGTPLKKKKGPKHGK